MQRDTFQPVRPRFGGEEGRMTKREPKYLDVGGTKVLESNCWRTPRWLFDALQAEFGCNLDAAARADDAHCEKYFGPDHEHSEFHDALHPELEWSDYADAAFANPPYRNCGGLHRWVMRMVDEGTRIPVCAVLPCTPSTSWFRDAMATAYELRLFDRRVNCLRPDGTPSKQARGDLCVFIWLPRATGPARVQYWDPPRVAYLLQEVDQTLPEPTDGADLDSLPF